MTTLVSVSYCTRCFPYFCSDMWTFYCIWFFALFQVVDEIYRLNSGQKDNQYYHLYLNSRVATFPQHLPRRDRKMKPPVSLIDQKLTVFSADFPVWLNSSKKLAPTSCGIVSNDRINQWSIRPCNSKCTQALSLLWQLSPFLSLAIGVKRGMCYPLFQHCGFRNSPSAVLQVLYSRIVVFDRGTHTFTPINSRLGGIWSVYVGQSLLSPNSLIYASGWHQAWLRGTNGHSTHTHTHEKQTADTHKQMKQVGCGRQKDVLFRTGSFKKALTFRWCWGWSHRVNHQDTTVVSESHNVVKTHPNFCPLVHHHFSVFLLSLLFIFVLLAATQCPSLHVLLLLSVALSIYISVCVCFLVCLCYLRLSVLSQ